MQGKAAQVDSAGANIVNLTIILALSLTNIYLQIQKTNKQSKLPYILLIRILGLLIYIYICSIRERFKKKRKKN